MNSFEMTDLDSDALTFITRDGSTWITCTSGADEVTVGPFPSRLLRGALTSEPGANGQFTTTIIGSSGPALDLQEAPTELRLLDPVSEDADALAVQPASLARREG
ncbi:MAG: hypothetical protein ACTIJK_17375 [Brachybacterium sp.]